MAKTGALYLKFILLTALILSVPLVSSCSRIPVSSPSQLPHSSGQTNSPGTMSEDETDAIRNIGIVQIVPEGDRYHYSLLDPEDQILYNTFLNSFLNMEGSVSVHGFDNESIYYVRNCVLRDYPELWYIGSGTITEYHQNGSVIDKEYSIAYLYSKTDIQKMQTEIENGIERFLHSVDPLSSDYEKLLSVYEYIILNTSYDKSAYELVQSNEDNLAVASSASVYGVFVKGTAICEGYSKAAQYLFNKLGISCNFASGTSAKDGIAHAWNFLVLDGETYFLDLTWGDPLSSVDQMRDMICYDYFCITTEQLLKTHIPDPAYPLPVCTAEKYNYFVQNGLLLEKYSPEAVLDILLASLAKSDGPISVKFTGDSEFAKAYRNLIEEDGIFTILKKIKENGVVIDTGSYSYSLDEQNNILTIYPKMPDL